VPTTERATNLRGKSTSKKKRATYESIGVDDEGMYSDTDSLVAQVIAAMIPIWLHLLTLTMIALTLSLTLMVK
jgi:hypothetical protein